ncbi:RHS repeat-associated core domain-containing protein, partial [Mucilaginibacter lutimaris]
EGRAARRSDGTYRYEYDLKDHLGNVRLTFQRNASQFKAERLQSDDYYAFGIRRSVPNNVLNNKYLYNGKELQEETSDYDYGARFYDPVIGRWTTIDPLAEKSRKFSPYTYGLDDPIRNIDRDGMFSTHVDEYGTVLKNVDDGDKGVYEHDGKTAKDVEKTYSKTNTGAGGEKLVN